MRLNSFLLFVSSLPSPSRRATCETVQIQTYVCVAFARAFASIAERSQVRDNVFFY